MGRGFPEVAYLRGNDKKYEENFSQIDWSSAKKEENLPVSKAIYKIENGEKILVNRYDDLKEYENDLDVLNKLKDDHFHYIGEDYEQ